MGISRRHNDRNCELEARKELGQTLLAVGKAEQALAHLRVALRLANELEQTYDQARVHDMLGDAFCDLGNIDRARSHWRQALGIYSQLGLSEAEHVAKQLLV
jgi:tetratricopeptide (TPR) repeat protein